MADRPARALSIADGDAPPPPLAGALAAWWRRAGGDVVVVRGRGAADELWVHLEGEPDDDRFAHDAADIHFFGPGVEDPAVRDAVRRAHPTADIVRGDPEPGMEDVTTLPLTTWSGFEPLGGAFRLLASRGPRARPVAHVVREVVYLVETHGAGHLLFDDADLAAFPEWLPAFEAELAHLPWDLTWEANVGGDRVRGRTDRGRLP